MKSNQCSFQEVRCTTHMVEMFYSQWWREKGNDQSVEGGNQGKPQVVKEKTHVSTG